MTSNITSDIDSDIWGVVLWHHSFWTLISQHLWYHSQYRSSGTVISELGWCDIGVPYISDSDLGVLWLWYQVNPYLRQPVPKAYRKCCVKFWTTPSVRTGFPAVIKHSLSEHLKCLKWNDLTSANLIFLERRMRSAAKRVEQSSGYGYLSKIEWFSLRLFWPEKVTSTDWTRNVGNVLSP